MNEYEFESYRKDKRRSIAKLTGQMGEALALDVLQDQGFTVLGPFIFITWDIKYSKPEPPFPEWEDSNKHLGTWEKYRKKQLNRLGQRIQDLYKALGQDRIEKLATLGQYAVKLRQKRETRSGPRDAHGVIPDFLAVKNGEIYVVEVKVNQSKIQTLQNELLNKAKELGFKSLIVKLEISVELKSSRLELP